MYYYRARFYSPEIGRFISSDPHAGWRSKPISFNNVYSYAYNNPMKYKDPNGKFGVLVAMGIAGLINGAISSYRGGDFVTGFAVGAIGTLFVATGAHLAVLASGATAGSGAAIFAGAIGGGLTNLAIASAMGVKGSGLILAFAAGAFGGAAIGKWGFSWTWKGETAQVNTANGVNDFNRGSVGSLPESPSAPSPATGQPSGTDTGGNGFTFCGIEGEQC